MTRYAATTEVSAGRSREEIERTLTRYGATAFGYGWEGGRATLQFKAKDRHVRFVLPLPDRENREFTHSSRGPHTAELAEKAWEQAGRQAWRALALVIKAKLEAVEAGISEFESEFLANVVLPDGQTVGQWIRPQITVAYEQREMPKMLPDYSEGADGLQDISEQDARAEGERQAYFAQRPNKTVQGV